MCPISESTCVGGPGIRLLYPGKRLADALPYGNRARPLAPSSNTRIPLTSLTYCNINSYCKMNCMNTHLVCYPSQLPVPPGHLHRLCIPVTCHKLAIWRQREGNSQRRVASEHTDLAGSSSGRAAAGVVTAGVVTAGRGGGGSRLSSSGSRRSGNMLGATIGLPGIQRCAASNVTHSPSVPASFSLPQGHCLQGHCSLPCRCRKGVTPLTPHTQR